MHRFRFGLLIERFSTADYVLETARRAEASGFDTFLIRDHLIEEAFGPQYAPWTTLAAVAQVTTTLRVGSFVIANDFRHPAVLAKEVTTLDQLSGGRAELGLGAGFLREEYRRAGMAFDANSVRLDRLEEALPIFDKLLRGQPVSWHGTHYQLDNFVSFPPPVQRPRPPLLVGGAGPRMLLLAAKYADSVALMHASLHRGDLSRLSQVPTAEHLMHQASLVREAAGQRADKLELCLVGTFVNAEDRQAAAQHVAAQRGWDLAADEVLRVPSLFIGEADAMADHLRQVRSDFGITYIVVRDSQLELAAPVIRQLT